MFTSLLTGPIQPVDHFIGLTIEYQLGLILFCISAAIAGIWDWKVRGAPFKTFLPAGVGALLILSYEFATAASPAFSEILAITVAIQFATIGGIGLFLYWYGIAGNDDALWLVCISFIPIGAGVIVVIGAIILFAHRSYRRYYKITANPYSDRYSRFYPYPMVTYLGIGVLVYAGYILITALI